MAAIYPTGPGPLLRALAGWLNLAAERLERPIAAPALALEPVLRRVSADEHIAELRARLHWPYY
jgi:hypothetical protein